MSGIFAKVFEGGRGASQGRGQPIPERREWEAYSAALDAWRSSASVGGQWVTPDSALRMAAVFACIQILAEDVASLPLFTYETLPRGRRKATNYYLYRLLHDRPNPKMTAMEYRETIQAHLAAWGNGYSLIQYDSLGQIEALIPIHPACLTQTIKRNGVRWYQFTDNSDDPPALWYEIGQKNWYSEAEIWHLRGLGDDGERGYSPISLMRRAVGLGMSAEEFGAKFFENDARPGIVLEHPATLSPEAQTNLKASIEDEHKGVKKSHRMMILEEGMKLHEVGIPPEDAQFLETRKFQVQEIARIFRIPPHMLADLDRATFSNIEHQSIEYMRQSLRPWLVRWEQSINENLMTPEERNHYYAEHLVDGMLRGDVQSRYQAYFQGRNGGWLSVNDIRELENMNPVDGGDVYMTPLNMVPANQAGDQNTGNSSANDANNTNGGGDGTNGGGKRNIQPVIQDVVERILRMMVHDIKDAAQRFGKKSDWEGLRTWMEAFWGDEDAFTQRQLRPLMSMLYGKDADFRADFYARQWQSEQRAAIEPILREFEEKPDLNWAEQLDEWQVQAAKAMEASLMERLS